MDPKRELPPPSARLLFHPEQDTEHESFRDAATHPFEATATAFSGVNGWWLAEAALLAYWDERPGDPNGARERFRRAGLDRYRFVASPDRIIRWTDTQCHVAGNDRFVIVSFRGSQPDHLADALNDATFPTTPFESGEGRVHAGFATALDAIWDPLQQAIAEVAGQAGAGRGPTMWLTGHSLGAALATLTAARLADRVQGVYTFGCPRVGNGAFRTFFERHLGARSWRYVNDHDIVATVPPAGVLGYDHVGTLVYFDDHGNTAPEPPASVSEFLRTVFGGLLQVRESVVALRQGNLTVLPAYLYDHTPLRYAVLAWNTG